MTARRLQLSVAAVLLAAAIAATAEAADPDEVDTSRWQCRFCLYPEGFVGSLEVGAGHVSGDAVKFGEWNDLEREQPFVEAGADVSWFGEGTTRWDLRARDLGLDTRSLRVRGGNQGRYEVRLEHDETVHHERDDAVTPFRGAETENLTLPGNWVRGSTTGGMSRLGSSLLALDLETKRRRSGIGATFQASENWSYDLEFSQQARDGRRLIGGAFLFRAAELVEPVEDETNNIDAAIRYQADSWQIGLAYHGSLYRNDNEAVVWDNPFTAATTGTDRGRQSLPADNSFHQLTLSGNARLSQRSHFAGQVSAGRMSQDDDFLPSTINSSLSPGALPRSSPDAQVDTLDLQARLTYNPAIAGLSTRVDYRGVVRDNETPVETFPQVVTDNFVGPDATNEPLSYGRHTLEGEASYRLGSGRRISGGASYERYDRDYTVDPSTNELVVWAQYRARPLEILEYRIKGLRSERFGSDQDPVVPNGSPENPRLVWFDIADRNKTEARGTVSLTPTDWLSVSLRAEGTVTDYGDTEIGRTDRTQQSYGLDVSAVPAEKTRVYGYFSRDDDHTEQRNSQGFSRPDWRGETDDTFNTIGLGGEINGLFGRLDLGADLSYSDSTGEVTVDTGAPTAGFPDFESERFTARFRGDYQLRENLGLGMNLIYEHFDSRDFQRDGVGPDTAPDLLSQGFGSFDHDVVVTSVTARYSF